MGTVAQTARKDAEARRGAAARLAAAGGVEDGAIRESPYVVQQHEVAALSWVRPCP